MRFPQGPVAIEQAAVQSGGQLEQLTHPARARQRGAAEVVIEFDLALVRPREVGDRTEKRRVLAEGGLDVGTPQHRLVRLGHEILVGTVRRLEELERADVHGVFAGFADQEHGIGRCYQLHGPSFAGMPDVNAL